MKHEEYYAYTTVQMALDELSYLHRILREKNIIVYIINYFRYSISVVCLVQKKNGIENKHRKNGAESKIITHKDKALYPRTEYWVQPYGTHSVQDRNQQYLTSLYKPFSFSKSFRCETYISSTYRQIDFVYILYIICF